jgi:L-rhamnonate dehydratase
MGELADALRPLRQLRTESCTGRVMDDAPRIEALEVETFRVLTGRNHHGHLDWETATVVTVHARAGSVTGLGWTYASRAAAILIDDTLKDVVVGLSAFDVGRAHAAMNRALRNVGRRGVGAMALSAIDVALWDLKARLLQKPLVELFGAVRDSVEVYGSGGASNLEGAALVEHLGKWIACGMERVKVRIGTNPASDRARVCTAHNVLPHGMELLVDAGGAYEPKHAIDVAAWLDDEVDVRWLEEPCAADDLDGLARVRDNVRMDVAAGQYAETDDDVTRLIPLVDCLQADATRCGGISGFLDVAARCQAAHLPLSANAASQLHAHVGCAAPTLRHVEHHFEHTRVDTLLFDGCLSPVRGTLTPDRARHGHGLTLKRADADRFRVH